MNITDILQWVMIVVLFIWVLVISRHALSLSSLVIEISRILREVKP